MPDPAKDGSVTVVDVAQLSDPHLLAAAVVEALSTTGFLFVRGHGLERQAESMFRIAEDFFQNETLEEKRRCAYAANKGYTSVSQERSVYSVSQLPPEFFSSRHHEGPHSRSILRFLHYPSIPAGAEVDPNRAGAHSDYGSLTLLFQRKNGGEGLQILPPSEPLDGGKWQDTGIVDDALLVNVGDALELWSGARLKSTLHRVVLPTPLPADGVPERYSIAWFNQPTPEASLRTCVDVTSISENDLARMERKGVKPGTEITADEHLQARLASTYNLSRSS